MQPPRLAKGLVLISLLVFVLAWQVAPAASQGTQGSTSGKKPAGHPSAGTTASSRKTPAKTAQKSSTGTTTKSTTAKKHSSKAGSKSGSKKSPKQQQPEPDRIREIQQALTKHGYPVESSGVWDASTVEALRKFQTDQNIDNLSGRGKLDSLTLIALGLGPKREPPTGASEAPKRSPEGHFP